MFTATVETTIDKNALRVWQLACLSVHAYRVPKEMGENYRLWRCEGMLSAYKNVLNEMGYSLQWYCDYTASAGNAIKDVRLVDPVTMTYIGME